MLGRTRATLLAILLASTAVHLASFQRGHDWGGDFAAYVAQARAIVEGTVPELAADAAFRLEHSTHTTGPALYPWGFPLLLAPVYALFGDDLVPMKVLVLAFAVACQGMTFVLFRGRLPDGLLLLLVLAMGLNRYVFLFKNAILSDLPFTFFALLSLHLIQRVVVERRRFVGPALDHALAGVAVLCATLVRTHGLALLLTLGAVQLVGVLRPRGPVPAAGRGSRAGRVALVPWVVFAAGYGAVGVALGWTDTSYLATGHFELEGLADVVAVLERKLPYVLTQLPRFFSTSSFALALHLALVTPLAVYGAWSRARADRAFLLFALLHTGVLLLLRFHQGVRFLLPVVPILLYFALAGTRRAFDLLRSRVALPARVPGWALLLLLLPAAYVAEDPRQRERFLAAFRSPLIAGPYDDPSTEVFAYIRQRTPASAVLTFAKPRVLTLLTGRRAIDRLRPEEIVDGTADHLLVGTRIPSNRESQVEEALEAYPSRFELLFENASFELYRIHPAAEGLPSATPPPP